MADYPLDRQGNSVPVFPTSQDTKAGVFTNEASSGFSMIVLFADGDISINYESGAPLVINGALAGLCLSVKDSVSVTTTTYALMS